MSDSAGRSKLRTLYLSPVIALVAVVAVLGGAGDRQTRVAVPATTVIQSAADQQRSGTGLSVVSQSRRPWTAIHNWVYWLDGPRPEEIGRSAFELAVIDYSADGTAAGEFSAVQIDELRHATCERRVLAYLSAGEAEDYRFYWQPSWQPDAPDWIVARNPDWPGNYLVRFWHPEWQRLIYAYLDRIIAQGYDGIYLDRIDAAQEPYAAGHEEEMLAFVTSLAAYARARSPLGADFGVVAQNAEDLGALSEAYAAALTGIAREEVYVAATNQPTARTEQAGVEADLDWIRRSSRDGLVLTVDYADQPELVAMAYEHARANGYVPYVTDVELGRIRLNAGFEPKCESAPGAPAAPARR